MHLFVTDINMKSRRTITVCEKIQLNGQCFVPNSQVHCLLRIRALILIQVRQHIETVTCHEVLSLNFPPKWHFLWHVEIFLWGNSHSLGIPAEAALGSFFYVEVVIAGENSPDREGPVPVAAQARPFHSDLTGESPLHYIAIRLRGRPFNMSYMSRSVGWLFDFIPSISVSQLPNYTMSIPQICINIHPDAVPPVHAES